MRLGSSELTVSRICLGMMSYGDNSQREWHLREDAAEPLVRQAVNAGVTFFDTADMYDDGESERVTGRLLSHLFPRRDDYVLATKVYFPMGPAPDDRGLSRKHVLSAIDASLTRLGTDYVDLYTIHRWDDDTPIEETMGALHEVVQAGKARFIGASSMYAWQFAKAQRVAAANNQTLFSAMQNHYNLIYREEEREMMPLCRDMGVAVNPYSPLARGFLTHRQRHDEAVRTARAANDPLADRMYGSDDLAVVAAVSAVADNRRVSMAQLALAWVLGRPGVCAPIVGATKPGHVEDAVAAVDMTLTDDEVARLETPYRPHPVLGH
jgi:aryl-alcohol dehydrogenase-like predicted oxidoreductase